MSESDGEKAARSVALEQAYVHEVYEQCAEKTAQSRHWPRIYKFLEELEPGALVCDIGCGNGKYLSVNDNVFKVGADRCKRLTDIAREKENEVLICDNLALPFRDESFDAVLSIAVVHHFATTERRVNALKELARVLRIGGRLVISVWAMEQRHRKFESQDVLVPWPKAYCLNGGSRSAHPGGKSSTGGSIPCINQLDPDRSAQKSLLTSKSRNDSRKCKKRNYWIDPIFSPSPSTSSLSSPNETCYSFFRRALQKLAGGKRDSGNRAWFLETWQSGGCKNRRNFEIDDIGDVDDIPIELRRLEDDNVTVTKLPDAHSIKSKSLGDILEIQHLDLVRSRSSIPGFSSSLTSEFYLDEESKAPSLLGLEGINLMRSVDDPELGPSSSSSSPLPPPLPLSQSQSQSQSQTQSQFRSGIFSSSGQQSSGSFSSGSKPRLVKQKTHLPDDGTLEFPEKPKNTAIQEFIEGLGEFENQRSKRGNVHKQSSMNEELMSMERLMERERVRRNIMKQASLNEEIICKPNRTFGHFRDTLYSGNATKRFQLIKSGLTNRIKQSTTSMEKVSSMALKNGFVKILQGWKSVDGHTDTVDIDSDESKKCKELAAQRKASVQGTTGAAGTWIASSGGGKVESETIERRLSKEDGSDSSKDSSLQSDTSVDSEDSFASVIYVPTKQQQQQQQQQHHYHHHHHHHYNNYQSSSNSHQIHYEHQFPSLIDVSTMPVGGYQLRTTSAPPSPRIKHPPEIHGPRLKLISISPLLKQFPATSKSLPPPSPPRLSPRNFNLFGPPCNVSSSILSEDTNIFKNNTDREESFKTNDISETNISEKNVKKFFGDEIQSEIESFNANCTSEKSKKIDEPSSGTEETMKSVTVVVNDVKKSSPPRRSSLVIEKPAKTIETEEKSLKNSVNNNAVTVNRVERIHDDVKPSVESVEVRWTTSGDNKSEKSSSESINDEDSRGSRLKQIKELLKQKPGFATRCGRSSFPLVRRASTATSGRPDSVDARTLPRLLSLELFNPETDDLDSDSSGLSSPESVGSVISVISDERFTLKNKDKSGKLGEIICPVTVKNHCDEVVTDVIPDNDDSQRQDIKDKVGDNAINEDSDRIVKISQVPIDPARDSSDSTIISSTHTRLSESSLIESYDARSISPCVSEESMDLSSLINNCKYSQLMDDTIAWLRGATGTENDYNYSEYTDNNSFCGSNENEFIDTKNLSEDTMDFVMVTKNGECIGVKDIDEKSEDIEREACTVETPRLKKESIDFSNLSEITTGTVGTKNKKFEREDSHESMEIEGSISVSTDATSRTDSLNNSRFSGGSATCLVSGNLEYKSLRERRKYLYQKRSASEETRGSSDENPSTISRRVDGHCDGVDAVVNRASPSLKSINISGSSSQESPISDYDGDDFGGTSNNGGGSGGAITYHQYYHVFREGELDQLINKYVENLHIISSYYDHASWCIVAEKVQVWTI